MDQHERTPDIILHVKECATFGSFGKLVQAAWPRLETPPECGSEKLRPEGPKEFSPGRQPWVRRPTRSISRVRALKERGNGA